MSARFLFVVLAAAVLVFAALPGHAENGPGAATVFRANGNGFNTTIFSPASGHAFPNGTWRAGDVDRDGRADLFHFMPKADHIDTWISMGDGGFKVVSFAPPQGYPTFKGDWMVGDVDGDGSTDAIHQAENKNYLLIWLSNGDGTYRVVKADPKPILAGRWLTGDISGDGHTDLVRVVDGNNFVESWISTTNGSFNVVRFSPAQNYAIPNGRWLMGRFNADNKVDIVHMVKGFDHAHVWESIGDGTFVVRTFRPWAGYPMSKVKTIPNPFGPPIPVAVDNDDTWLVGDFDANGLDDVLHGIRDSDVAHIWSAKGGSGGNPLFTMSTFRPSPNYEMGKGTWLAADIDGNKKTDIIHAVSGQLRIWISTGGGAFNVATARVWPGYSISDADQGWVTADLTRDGMADLVHVYTINPVRPLRVRHHASATLSSGEAERILTDMTGVLFRNDNDATDQACPIRFALDGPVDTFTETDGIINNADDFNAMLRVPGRVKVVSQINWCGMKKIPGTAIIGCGLTPGDSFAVVRQSAAVEGSLWAHEYGHNRSLSHRNDVFSVMNPFVGPTELGVSQTECRAYP